MRISQVDFCVAFIFAFFALLLLQLNFTESCARKNILIIIFHMEFSSFIVISSFLSTLLCIVLYYIHMGVCIHFVCCNLNLHIDYT